MELKPAFVNLGQAFKNLSRARIINASYLMGKYSNGKRPDGFLYSPEDALRLSNELTQKAALYPKVFAKFHLLPLTASDLETYSPMGAAERFSFFVGYNG